MRINGQDESTRIHLFATAFEHSVGDLQTLSTILSSRDALRIFRGQFLSRFDQAGRRIRVCTSPPTRQEILREYAAASQCLAQSSWELSITRNESQLAESGGVIRDEARGHSQRTRHGTGRNVKAQSDRGGEGTLSPSFDFLARGAVLIPNLQADSEGRVRVDLQRFQGLSQIVAVVVDANGTTYRKIALSRDSLVPSNQQQDASSEIRVVSGRACVGYSFSEVLCIGVKLAEMQRVHILKANEPNDLGDVLSPRARVYGSLGEVYAFYATMLQQDTEFAKFSVWKSWNGLKDDEKEIEL